MYTNIMTTIINRYRVLSMYELDTKLTKGNAHKISILGEMSNSKGSIFLYMK